MKYEFDKVFDVSATQEDVFNTVAKDRVIGALRDGMNCSILAYGQVFSIVHLSHIICLILSGLISVPSADWKWEDILNMRWRIVY